jgi:hypothetical protein
MESVPDFETLHERKTSAEVSAALDEYLSADSTAEADSKETAKYGGGKAKSASSDIDSAFADLLGA